MIAICQTISTGLLALLPMVFTNFKYSPIFLDKVPGVAVLSYTLFEEDAAAVYLFVKTRHPEAAKVVLEREN